MSRPNKICYNCGRPLTADNATVEHVPAKNLYDGFENQYKVNRITVPACYDCNQMYSKVDQEMRDALAVKSDSEEQKKILTGKGVKSILRRSNWQDRSHFNHEGQVIAVDFSYDDLKKIHIKNFKALFFRKYGFPVPDNFDIVIVADGDDDKKVDLAKVLYDYAKLDKQFEHSGHPDIFKFIIKDLTQGKSTDNLYESGDFNKLIGVTGLLIYHDDIGAIVLAGKKDFIESCNPNRR